MFKINISEKGKSFHIDSESGALVGKELNDKISGVDVSPELNGYEFQIMGASDKSGFPVSEEVEGIGLKGILIGYGVGLKKKSRREGKKKRSNFKPRGLRMRRKARGKIISPEIMQINLKVLKEGNKKLSEIFPEQNKPKEVEKKLEAPAAQ
ncbi:hypothetical protein HY449_02105 [Candidatus Pacearchaeota archaeon]|nr:hypothetical protein [Candidatus Pacearchaeota archaeon]